MSEIYRPDEKLEKEVFDKEYVRHVEARMKRAEMRRAQQVEKNRKLCLIAGAVVLVLIIIVCLFSCSNGGNETETTTPEVTTASETTAEETTLVAMYTTDVLNLRAEPNTDCQVITQIGAGKKVEIISEEGKWCKVKRGKDEGYVMKKYLSYTNSLN